jgi:uncharacterized protein YceK
MRTLALAICMAALCTCLTGCGTIAAFADEDPVLRSHYPEYTIYGGVRSDWLMKDNMWFFAFVPILDLPFSFTADTILLPYSIPKCLLSKTRPKQEAKKQRTGANQASQAIGAPGAPQPER